MILTNCAACAAPLAHDAPRCVRCWTRYCDANCQHDHWRRGHKQICKTIHRGGNAEQYHADKKYKEAVAVAVEACAADTKGQTCYICTEGIKRRTGEGLVSGFCACRGGSSFAHVSCLAEQAQILFAEAEDNNLGAKAWHERWDRWYTCSLCEQKCHGVVACALGWACWKTYVGRPETNWARISAITQLGTGLFDADHFEDALPVFEATLSMKRRLGATEQDLIGAQGNLANAYQHLGRLEEALRLRQDVYSRWLKLKGEEDEDTLREAMNYAFGLCDLKRFEEAKSILRRSIPVAMRVLGENHEYTLRLKVIYAQSLFHVNGATVDDLREGVTTLEDTTRIARRVFGGAHPITIWVEGALVHTRMAFRIRRACSLLSGPLVFAFAVAAFAWVWRKYRS